MKNFKYKTIYRLIDEANGLEVQFYEIDKYKPTNITVDKVTSDVRVIYIFCKRTI